MQEALAGVDHFNLTRTPNFEPRRGAAVPTYIASSHAPLVYLPIRGGDDPVSDWLKAIDRAHSTKPQTKLSQNDLRDWMRSHPGHRSFSVLRHPLGGAHAVFCHRILNIGQGGYGGIRSTLIKRYNVPLPADPDDASYGKVEHRAAFAKFLGVPQTKFGQARRQSVSIAIGPVRPKPSRDLPNSSCLTD